jgi:hypothetical protein
MTPTEEIRLRIDGQREYIARAEILLLSETSEDDVYVNFCGHHFIRRGAKSLRFAIELARVQIEVEKKRLIEMNDS